MLKVQKEVSPPNNRLTRIKKRGAKRGYLLEKTNNQQFHKEVVADVLVDSECSNPKVRSYIFHNKDI